MGSQKFEYLVYDMKDKELLVNIGNIWEIEKFTGSTRSNICKAIQEKRLVGQRYKIRKQKI